MGLAGCGSASVKVTVSSVDVSLGQASLPAGITTTVNASAKYSNGKTEDITTKATWSSSDTSVALVACSASSCQVTTLKPGTATFTATLSGVSGTIVLTVTHASLTGLSAGASKTTIATGETATLTAQGAFTDGTHVDISTQVAWSSSDATIASVSGNTATGVAVGSATMTATLMSQTATVSLTIVRAPVVPGAPTQVAATGSDGGANVSWVAPQDDGGSAITGFTITSYPGGATLDVGSSANNAVLSGLTNGMSYTFTVKAKNAIGTGPESEASNPVVPATVPGKPTGVLALAGDGEAEVAWTAPLSNGGSAITGYTVTTHPGSATHTAAASASSLVVSGLINGTAYTFTVRATNAAGDSADSDPSDPVTPIAVDTSKQPTSVTAVAGNAQATISWTAPATNGVTFYTVITRPGFTSTLVEAPATTATITGLANGTSYTFVVRATFDTTDGPLSAASNAVTPQADPPGAPTNVQVTATASTIDVSWTAPVSNGGSPITSYTATATPDGATCTADATTTHCSFAGLSAGTTYTFTVHATNARGNSPESDPSETIQLPTVPSVVENESVEAGDHSAIVSWEAPDDGGSPITGYEVRVTDGDEYDQTFTTDEMTTTLTVDELHHGRWYNVYVRAVNAVGAGSWNDDYYRSVYPDTAIAGPTNVVAVAGIGSVSASWDPLPASPDYTLVSYKVETGGNASAYGLTDTHVTLTNYIYNGWEYTLSVRAIIRFADGTEEETLVSESNTVTVQIPPPTNLEGTFTDNTITVTWTPPAGAPSNLSYFVRVTLGGNEVTSTNTSATSFTLNNAFQGNDYLFSIKGVYNNERGYNAAEIHVRIARLPTPPQFPYAFREGAGVHVYWTRINNDGGYPITGYTVTATPGGKTWTVADETFDVIASGLDFDTPYTFTVHSTTQLGNSVETDPVGPFVIPSAPTNVLAVAGNGYVNVTWSPPAYTTGLQGYLVRIVGSSDYGMGADSTSIRYDDGVINGQTYEFEVLAYYDGNYYGPPSLPSNAVTPMAVVPNAPNVFDPTLGDGQVTINWLPQPDGGSPITGFHAVASPGGASCSAGPTDTSCVITGLTNGQQYTFDVYETNAIGDSLPNEIGPYCLGVCLAHITVDQNWMSLPAGRTHQITIVASYTDGSEVPVDNATATWTTDDPSIATVSSTGLITSRYNGRNFTTVHVTWNGETVDIAVETESAVFDRYAVLPSTLSIGFRQQGKLGFYRVFSDGSKEDWSSYTGWKSDDSSVSAAGEGYVTGERISATGANVSVKWGADTFSAKVTVTDAVSDSLVIVTPSESDLAAGLTRPLKAYRHRTDGYQQPITLSATWTSDSPEVATVTAGVVTGVSGGTAHITATDDETGLSGSIDVNIAATHPGDFLIDAPQRYLPQGLSMQLRAYLVNEDLSLTDVTSSTSWESDAAVIVDSEGLATAVQGYASPYIIGRYADGGGVVLVIVPQDVKSVDIEPKAALIPINTTPEYSLVATLVNNDRIDVTSIATFNLHADVGPIGELDGMNVLHPSDYGTGVVSAMVGTQVFTQDIEVVSAIENVTVSPDPIALPNGYSRQLIATAHLADGGTLDLTQWATWTTDAYTNVIQLSKTGVVKCVGIASSYPNIVSANWLGFHGENAVTTNGTLSSIALQDFSVTAGVPTPLSVTATLGDGNAVDATSKVTWASDVCSVSTAGVLTCALDESATSVTVTASIGALTSSKTVNITQ